mmetsp:Transcript_127263/g.360170  ORF Transcript_127263/g.360170 Transcript_127263/m.360170 type:complete len:119 (+) Transcript_127263:86-442(+)
MDMTRAPDEPLAGQIASMEEQARRLQEDLAVVLSGLAEIRGSVRAAEDTAGDRHSDKMRKEVEDVLRRQTQALEAMAQTAQDFPRQWARLEIHTSQRKALMLNIKARRRRDDEPEQQT